MPHEALRLATFKPSSGRSRPPCCRVPRNDQENGRTIRLRLITPGAKSMLGMSLRHRNRTYGFLVIARKETATFAKKEKTLMEQASEEITKSLEREGLFDMNVVLSRP